VLRLRFFDDPARFLDRADGLLAEQSLVGTVLATWTERAVRDDAAGVPLRQGVPRWWVLVERVDHGAAVMSAAMRTAPFAPYPMYVLPMSPAAAVELARHLHERGERVTAMNGALPAARILAEETARLTGGSVSRRLAEGRTWLWENESGEVVHLTGATLASRGVSRIGPVYTPAGHRGNGYASWVVAEVAGRLTELGERVCLFTDQANPTSNAIYQRIGFTPVVDMANLVVITERR
jgi:predicted GNAT family acetyltransferase